MTTVRYQGKAKTLYKTDNPNELMMEFRDDATAFNAQKHAQLNRKGLVNNYLNEFFQQHCQQAGIPTHFIARVDDTMSRVKNLDMIALESVVRNFATGSLCQRLGIERGVALQPSIFEYYYKNDDLNDPLVNQSHIISFGWATEAELARMHELSAAVNAVLQPLFLKANLKLVDFKVEFGRYQGDIILGDEFTPDNCRLWDIDTGESYDKDRFRQDLGNVIESYEVIAQRLQVAIPA